MRNKKLTVALTGMMMAGAAPALSAAATDPETHGAMHESHIGSQPPDTVPAIPLLAGQDAFAAIQEIVAILESDPATDWSRVDLDALRLHLVDMNALVLRARVATREISGGLETVIDGAGPAGEAARGMVPAHAAELSEIDGWSATARTGEDGRVVLKVTATDPVQTVRIRGLGFFGLMATGAHHQRHHLAVARGGGMHE